MLALATFLSFLLSISAAAALPSPPTGIAIPIHKRISFSPAIVADVPALQAQLGRLRIKFARGFDAYKTNTGNLHPLAVPPNSNTTDIGSKRAIKGAEPLGDFQEELWYGSISVGTPAKVYTIDFDTGSSDLFLPSPACGASCNGHNRYDPSASSTSKDLKKTFRLRYGNGSSSVEGDEHTDTVTVAGLSATDQTLGAATMYTPDFAPSQFPPDGLMGLAFQSISVFNASPFFNTLISQRKVRDEQFAFYLAESESELYLGGVNPARYKGPFNWVPVTQEGYWQVDLEGVRVNNTEVVSRLPSIIDSGTTTIVGDPENVKKFYAAIPGSSDLSNMFSPGIYGFPCNSIPSVSLTFGGKHYSIAPKYFNLGRVSKGSSTCVGAVMADPTLTGHFWVVGDVFMRNVYTAFSYVCPPTHGISIVLSESPKQGAYVGFAELR